MGFSIFGTRHGVSHVDSLGGKGYHGVSQYPLKFCVPVGCGDRIVRAVQIGFHSMQCVDDHWM